MFRKLLGQRSKTTAGVTTATKASYNLAGKRGFASIRDLDSIQQRNLQKIHDIFQRDVRGVLNFC